MTPINLTGITLGQAGYALSKHIPSMRRGFTISTAYGEIEIPEEHAKAFADRLESKLERAAQRLTREQAHG